MGVTMEMTKAYLDSRGFHYQVTNEGTVLRTRLSGLKNMGSIDIAVIFDNDKTVSIRAFNICKIPENKKDSLYKICSEMNYHFRWVKFYVDEQDNSITAADDAIVESDSSGEEILELINRMAAVTDNAYPEMMKAIWG